MEIKVLVLGNDPQINLIDFNRLDTNIITIGINRIWLKYYPNYLFFNDYDIIKELKNNPEHLANVRSKSTIFSSDWLFRSKKDIPKWVSVYNRPSRIMQNFPDSATTAISLFKNNYYKEYSFVFYIAGISLTWKEPSHFWKELNYKSLNTCDSTWYNARFQLILNNFKKLKDANTKMISVTPESMLNKLLRYECIDNLYVKEKL